MRLVLSVLLVGVMITITTSACTDPTKWQDSNGDCQPCHISCTGCTEAGDDKCITCNSGYILISGRCRSCLNNCSTCAGTRQYCTSCKTGFVMHLPNSSCLAQCPVFYVNTSNICTIIFCTTKCGNCSGITQNNCTSCFYNFKYFSDVKNCVPSLTYDVALQTEKLTYYSNNSATFTCGIYSNMPGMFSPGDRIILFNLNPLKSHVAFRFMVWVMWIDYWNNGSYIQFKNANNLTHLYHRVNYSSADNRQQHQCEDTTIMERVSIVDIVQSHNSSSLSIQMTSDACSGCNGKWAYKDILLYLSSCHNYCLVCTGTSNSQCSQCATYQGFTYLLSGTTCEKYCLQRYYFNQSAWSCPPCTSPCYSCQFNGTYCIKCITNHVFFPPNHTCPPFCPDGYYHNLTTNQCQPCYQLCKKCTGYPAPCQQCHVDIYFMPYNDTCWNPCPSTFFQLDMLWLCLLADDYFVNLTISFQQNDQSLTIFMNFSQSINFSTFPIKSFQTISFQDTSVTLDKFNINYNILNDSTYSITLTPKGIIFMRKVPVIVKTIQQSTTLLTSTKNIPLSNSTYNQISTTLLTFKTPPELSVQQSIVVHSFSKGSSGINSFFNQKSIQDIKQMGVFLMLFNYLQIPAMLMLLNIVYPVSFYNGNRIFASFVLMNVPPYEQQYGEARYVFSDPWYEISSRRLLQSVSSPVVQWRFQRSGFVGNFILDCYGNLILLAISFVLIILSHLLLKYWKTTTKNKIKLQKFKSFAYSFLHRVNDVIIFFFILSIFLQTKYFTPTPFNIFSAILCIIANSYLLLYRLKIFYDLHLYEYYKGKSLASQLITKYGSLIKWSRFQEINFKNLVNFAHIKQLFKPFNYHVLSYAKKALMLLSICMFYDFPLGQISMLIVLQLLEIIRFILTKPYQSRWRNIVTFGLEIVLLILFILTLVNLTIINKIHSHTDLQINRTLGAIWIKTGWVALGFLWVYIIGRFFIDIIGIYYSFRYDNKTLINLNKKNYFQSKVQTYKKCNVQAPTNLVQNLVKKINHKNKPQTPIQTNLIQIQVQQVIMKRLGILSYQIQINKPLLKTDKVFNNKNCKIIVDQIIQKICLVSRKNNFKFFSFVDGNFRAFEINKQLEKVTLKTYAEIDQSDYKTGQKINIEKAIKFSHHAIMKQANSDQDNFMNFDEKLEHFPIDQNVLKELLQYNNQ